MANSKLSRRDALSLPAGVALLSMSGNTTESSIGVPRPQQYGNAIATVANVSTTSVDTLVADSLKPLVRNEDVWSAIRKRFVGLYGSEGPSIAAADTVFSLGVEGVSAYNRSPSNSYLPSHVEILLNQSAELLERCLASREEWRSKAARAATLGLDIGEFLENDEVHKLEIAAGIYSTPYHVSKAELNASLARTKALEAQIAALKTTIATYFTRSALDAFSDANQKSAFVALASNQAPFNYNNRIHSASEHARDAATTLSSRAFNIELESHQAQLKELESALNQSNETIAGLQKKAEWDLENIEFKRRRTQVARDIADYKVKLATDPAGAFAYMEQMKPLAKQFERDLSDALDRLKSTEVGLRRYYGYTVPLPTSTVAVIDSSPNLEQRLKVLDETILWVRNAIAYLVSFTQLEQSYTLTTSLRQLVGTSKWMAGLANGQWEFEVSENMFADQRYVRVRGVNLFTSNSSPSGFWVATLKAPPASSVRHFSGSSGSFSQSHSLLRLGRVGNRDDFRFPENYGGSILRNASPFGQWTITLNNTSTSGLPRSKCRDIEIDLDVVVRSVV